MAYEGAWLRRCSQQARARRSKWRVMLLLLALPLVGNGIAAATVRSTTTRVQGKLVYRAAPTSDIWKLLAAGGVAYKLPGQPLDSIGGEIPSGSIIALDCTSKVGSDGTDCISIDNAEVTRAAAPVKSTDLVLRLLVMVVNLTGSCTKAGASVDQVRQAYTAVSGYTNFLRNCSYDKVTYSTEPGGVTVIETAVQCNQAILMCEEDAVAYGAQVAAAQQYGVNFLASFNRFSYVLPKGISACYWVGLADLPGMNTWYSPTDDGIFNKGTVLQESLHNFGIYHGWRGQIEYADTSTAMGSGNSCPSAPELWRLGWASVLDLLDNSTLSAGVIKGYILPATSLGPTRNMLKIRPDWLGESYTMNLYLALRLRLGGDQDIGDEFNRKISIHYLDKSIDNNFGMRGDPKVTILGTIDARSTMDLGDYKLLVKTGDFDGDGAKMPLWLCRYKAQATECAEATELKGNAVTSNDVITTQAVDYDSYRDAPPSPSRSGRSPPVSRRLPPWPSPRLPPRPPPRPLPRPPPSPFLLHAQSPRMQSPPSPWPPPSPRPPYKLRQSPRPLPYPPNPQPSSPKTSARPPKPRSQPTATSAPLRPKQGRASRSPPLQQKGSV
ncbi:hypothetical protein Vretimale_2156 [Volvox reticuliferus]|uniref:Uncharacterized protein n=1 Tax=Volvox reticuliferus TaxID=1737510 RepID=A0A8J4G2S4_9CHLO|nr:hypothetical protein Vretifemale_4464 [Volvox reticuliferus]GIL96434.1 hypothetical protein Vretimale_2156 [Volvox reticuliferus]